MKIVSLCLVLIFLSLGHDSFSFGRSSRQDLDERSEKVYDQKEVDRKARITKRYNPRYTEQARKNHTAGVVVLRVVLKSSGEVGNIEIVAALQDGLTEECMYVTRSMRFVPAEKDGKPVSQWARVEYTFSLD
jgi:TonB family protein